MVWSCRQERGVAGEESVPNGSRQTADQREDQVVYGSEEMC